MSRPRLHSSFAVNRRYINICIECIKQMINDQTMIFVFLLYHSLMYALLNIRSSTLTRPSLDIMIISLVLNIVCLRRDAHHETLLLNPKETSVVYIPYGYVRLQISWRGYNYSKCWILSTKIGKTSQGCFCFFLWNYNTLIWVSGPFEFIYTGIY